MKDLSLGDMETLGGGEERREGYVLSAGEVLGQYRIILYAETGDSVLTL